MCVCILRTRAAARILRWDEYTKRLAAILKEYDRTIRFNPAGLKKHNLVILDPIIQPRSEGEIANAFDSF